MDGVWLLTPDGTDDGELEADGDCEGGDGTDGDRPLDGTDDGFGSRRDDERKGPRFSSLGESRNAQPENSKILPAVPYGNDSIPRARRFRSNADDACRNVYLVLVTEEMSHPATSLSKEEAPSNAFRIFVTEEVFHLEMSPSNEDADRNMPPIILLTEETFHIDKSLLNTRAPLNMEIMFVTERGSHRDKSLLNSRAS